MSCNDNCDSAWSAWLDEQPPEPEQLECMEATAAELRWRHSHWHARREKIVAAMKRMRTVAPRAVVSWKRCDRFCNCGAGARLLWSPTARRWRIAASYCHDRLCEPCMRAKANRLAVNLEKKLTDRPHARYRFITLTLKHSQDDLAEQLARLVKHFRKLRSTPWWKSKVHGGAATIEVKLNDDSWHPHLHIVTDSEWMNQSELSQIWHDVTGDSFIVDVRQLKDAHEAAFYVAKYITKGTTPNVWNDDTRTAEWITAVKGVRSCLTFGAWRGTKLTAPGEKVDDWEDNGQLVHWISRAADGDRVASDVLISLRPPGTNDAIDWQ